MATGDDTKLPLTSRDVHRERLARFRELFPEAFSEGKTDFKKLVQLLGDAASDAPERYGLSWAGKSDALRAIQVTSQGTLLPAREESVNFDTTENLIIEGDNLEVLKLLQGGYHGQVKMIYIDPPYNTGGEFIYPDNYSEGLADYLKFSGQVSGEGIKLTTNAETDGRYHSKWLTMMYPRLFLARNLLREDGVIFVSIDDHEAHNLRAVMNEVFGEENFVAQLIWEKGRKNDAKLFSVGHEYMLVFARSLLTLRENKTVWREEKPGARDIWEKYVELRAAHGNDDRAIEQHLGAWYAALPKGHPAKKWSRYKRVDSNGPWRDRDISWPGGGGPRYDVIHPKFGVPCEVPERGWIYSDPQEMKRKIKLGLVEFREEDTKPPFRKAHIRPVVEELEADSDFDEDTGDEGDEGFATQVRGSYFYKQSQVAVKYLRRLLGGKVFNNPKDHEEIAKLIRYVMGGEISGIVLDFFAGSGTTAQAVLELNAEDAGNRKFILVQLPEPTDRKDFPTITDITKERVRRVIKKMEADLATKDAEDAKKSASELPLGREPASDASRAARPDLGFKVFKLGGSNFKLWDAASAPKDGAGLAEQLQLMAHNVEDGRPDEAVLYELILKSNLPVTSKIVSGKIGAQTFYNVADGTLAICLERPIQQETLRGLVARKPKGVICLDIAFAGNDQLKANTVLEMKSHGIEFHTA
jgi:adenine-specific DNA-methyltransferase